MFVWRLADVERGQAQEGRLAQTPALELPIMQAAFLHQLGEMRKAHRGQKPEAVLGQGVDDAEDGVGAGRCWARISTKFRPLSTSAPNSASACAPMVSVSEVTGWKTQMPNESKKSMP